MTAPAPDTVHGLIEPCLNHFELWSKTGREYRSGDEVGPVGMAETYSVQHWLPYKGRELFLWVQEGKITNLAAHAPIGERSVFDPNGRYLGRGGYSLEDINEAPERVDLLTAIENLNSPGAKSKGPSVPQTETKPKPSSPPRQEEPKKSGAKMLTHRLHLREDLEIALSLPADLSREEVEKLKKYLDLLSFY